MHGHKYEVDIYPLDTIKIDTVLGYPWLESLGDVQCNWRDRRMFFRHKGQQAILSSKTFGSVAALNQLVQGDSDDNLSLVIRANDLLYNYSDCSGLVVWHSFPSSDATWEDVDELRSQFLHLRFKDNVIFRGERNRLVTIRI
ncbi:hypothetical protein ACLOJK_007386 [Asimina triloba]